MAILVLFGKAFKIEYRRFLHNLRDSTKFIPRFLNASASHTNSLKEQP